MKAIYINLDPYLAQIAAWLKAGKPGDAPTFNPLPLAVTVPLGESAAIYLNGFKDNQDSPGVDNLTVDGQSLGVFETVGDGDDIVTDVTPALSALAPGAHYYVRAVTGDVSVLVTLSDEDGNEYPFTVPVLVRRETASGPVDLVDFTPPAAPTAADIKSALVEAGADALAGVDLGKAIIQTSSNEGANEHATLFTAGGETYPINASDGNAVTLGGESAS